ncbi:MAG: methyltransferase domain-containing protein [Chloroflexota bacterium]
MTNVKSEPSVNFHQIRTAIQKEYDLVANHPEQGFHFHTGRPLLTNILSYDNAWLDAIADEAIDSAAGTGNPFREHPLLPGDNVVDVGCGAGIDSLIAADMVGPRGKVIGVDMTPAMLAKAQTAAEKMQVENVSFRQGFAESLPVLGQWADVVISNGVLNLFPDKEAGLAEMARVLKPNGRLQIADILVQKPVPEAAKDNIDLWTG